MSRVDIVMVNIPNALDDTYFSEIDLAITETKIRAMYLAKLCEIRLISYFEFKFKKAFKTGHETQSGYDVISKDGLIKVEVKTCTKTSGRGLRGQKFKNKINNCDHVALIDLSDKEPRISVIPHDDFFSEEDGQIRFTKNGDDLYDTFFWNKSYAQDSNEVRNSNTKMFLTNEITLNDTTADQGLYE